MKRSLAIGLTLASLAVACAEPASATQFKEFDFTGTCSDCIGTAKAELKVKSSYNLGDTISSSNFVSFHYDGTNKLDAFTFTVPDVTSYSGSISTYPGMNTISLFSGSLFFHAYNTGVWSAGHPSDQGTGGTWGPANPAPAPVPGAGLLSLAFFALAGLRSRARTFLKSAFNPG